MDEKEKTYVTYEIPEEGFKEKLYGKFQELKQKVTIVKNKAVYFVCTHPNEIVTGITLATTVVVAGAKLVAAVKPSAAELHEKRMDCTYYDPSTGLHWDLKRNLTNSQRVELMSRKRNGEFTEDILADMGVLK